MNQFVKRRTYLKGLAAASLGTGGGCLSKAGGPSDAVRLGWYNVANFDTESHRFGLRIERDGEQVHHSSHVVQGRTDPDSASEHATIYGATARCTWDDTASDYTVAVRVDGGQWVTKSLTASDSETDCTVARAEYDNANLAADEFAFWTDSCANVRRYTGGCEFAETTVPPTN